MISRDQAQDNFLLIPVVLSFCKSRSNLLLFGLNIGDSTRILQGQRQKSRECG